MRKLSLIWGAILIALSLSTTACTDISAQAETPTPIKSDSKIVANSFDCAKTIGKHAQISDSALLVDAKNKSGFLRAAETSVGLFQPNKSYIIKFKCRIESAASNAYFLFAVRSESLGPRKDIASTSIRDAQDFKDVEMQITTPAKITDYSLKFSTHGVLKGEIKDLKIIEGNGLDFYPFAQSSREYRGEIGKIATGCPEFTVNLPAPKEEAQTVNAADFGAIESNLKFTDALNAAIEHCKKIGAKKLTLPKGVYYLYNSDPVRFSALNDFEFDGNGSTFVFIRDKKLAQRKGLDAAKIAKNYNESKAIVIEDCLRTKIGNFNIDWDWSIDPLGSFVKVVKVNTNNANLEDSYIDYLFVDYQKFPRRDVRVANLSSYDPVRNAIGIEGGSTLGYEFYKDKNVPKIQWISDNVLRVWNKNYSKSVKVGQMFRMQHYYYDGVGITTHSNQHLTLENINVYSAKGHAFVVSGSQQYWQYLNCTIRPPEGAKARAITCTADHLHVVNSRGFMKVIGCDFMFGADDCINVHDCTGYTVKKSDFSVETRNVKGISMFKIGDPIELRDDDFSPSGFIGKIKSVKPIDASKGIHEITFAEKIPAPKGDGFIMFNRYYNSGNVLLRDCKFHNNRARGIIIQCSNVTVENCLVQGNEAAGMRIVTGYTPNLWSEGYGVDNLLVRNCVFDATNQTDVKADGFARDIHIGIYRTFGISTGQTMYPIMSNITFENNTFKNAYGMVAFITSSGNVIFKDNIIINDVARQNPLPYRGSFLVKASTGTTIVNNTYVKSPNSPNPGVYTQPDTVKKLKIGGNRIVDKLD